MTTPPLRTCMVLAALALTLGAGFAEWAFVSPDDPFRAFLRIVIAGGSATAALLPFMLS